MTTHLPERSLRNLREYAKDPHSVASRAIVHVVDSLAVPHRKTVQLFVAVDQPHVSNVGTEVYPEALAAIVRGLAKRPEVTQVTHGRFGNVLYKRPLPVESGIIEANIRNAIGAAS